MCCCVRLSSCRELLCCNHFPDSSRCDTSCHDGRVADDDKTRSRRRRLHAQGDHSTCVLGRCDALLHAAGVRRAQVAADPAPVVADDGVRRPGGIESAVVAFVASLPYRDPDPRALLGLIAVRLAQRVDETGALPAAVRELRVLLVQLVEVPNSPSGVVDEVRLRAAQRRLDSILATAG